MAFVKIDDVTIRGISAAVPKFSQEVKDISFFSPEEAEKFSRETGVERRRLVQGNITSSDLCYSAAEKLIDKLGWQRNEIDCLLFVTQTPDYILPSSSSILQHRLRLKEEVVAMDISLGCSGWIYGSYVMSNLLSNGQIKRGLLLAGDTISKTCSSSDKSTFPMFGDAGTATAFEFHPQSKGLKFHLATDGSGANAIIVPDGAYRNMYSEKSSVVENLDSGISRAPSNLHLDGMSVFSFGISKAPESVASLLNEYDIDINSVDYYIFHQANLFMNEKIRKKLKIPEEKVPYTLRDYGNTSSGTIPITLIEGLRKEDHNQEQSIVACGFGVGLSWGSVWFSSDNILCPEIVEI